MLKIKKILFLIFVISIIAISGNSFAQYDKKENRGSKHTPEEIATKITDRLSKDLDLSEDQIKKIYELNLRKINEKRADKEKLKNLDKTEKKELRKQFREKYQTELESILSKDQIDKLNTLREQHKKSRKNKHKNKSKEESLE